MLVPTSKETAFLVVVELNKVKDSEPPSKWCRIHPVMVDFFINDPIKGQISTMTNKLGFIPLHFKMNYSDSVVIIYGKKGCLIAGIPSREKSDRYRKS